MMRQNNQPNSGDVIIVKILPLGESPMDVTLEKDSTVGQALEAADYAGHEARVNGVLARSDDILDDGDRVVVSNTDNSKISGGI